MDLPSLEKQEMNSSPPTDLINADSSRPEKQMAANLQKLFKSTPRLCKFNRTGHGVTEKIRAETTTKFSCYKSDKLFGSGGKTFFYSQGHTGSGCEITPTTVCFSLVIYNLESFQE